MSKLFVVMYLAGKIGAAWGPVPYDMNECLNRVADIMSGVDPTVVTPNGYTAKDVRFECEYHVDPPKLELE